MTATLLQEKRSSFCGDTSTAINHCPLFCTPGRLFFAPAPGRNRQVSIGMSMAPVYIRCLLAGFSLEKPASKHRMYTGAIDIPLIQIRVSSSRSSVAAMVNEP